MAAIDGTAKASSRPKRGGGVQTLLHLFGYGAPKTPVTPAAAVGDRAVEEEGGSLPYLPRKLRATALEFVMKDSCEETALVGQREEEA